MVTRALSRPRAGAPQGGASPGTRFAVAVSVGVVAVGVLFARFAGSSTGSWPSTFLLVFSSLLVQSFPFVLVGAAVSACIEVFVRPSTVAPLNRLPAALRLPAAAISGVAFPLCECGSVPVARRLAAKGLAAGSAVAFMLAAPVINPIVLVSTAVAYRGRDVVWIVVGGRFVLGVVAAVAVGWVSSRGAARDLLAKDGADAAAEPDGHGPTAAQRGVASRELARHFADDTMFMARYLVLGAAAAAALQAFVPQSVLRSVGGVPVLDILAMMALAALLSLCSESDAFVAASFVQFGTAAQLAFLLVGPMCNIKLGALYAGTFSRRFLRTVAVVVAAVVFVAALWVEVLVR